MKYVVADFESASRADLAKIGAWKYAADMSTMVLCLALKVVTDNRPAPTRVLSEKQLHARDPELLALCNDPAVIFVAHNAGFEQAMWKFHMVPMGYPELPPERWHDTMAVAGMKALPLGLDALVTALELPVKKDMDGHRHMLVMCKPDKHGGWSQHNDYNLQRLQDYCVGDVDAQYGVYVSTRGLGPSERHTWILDQKVNQRGIKIDREFVHACIDVLEQVKVPMTQRFIELTGLRPTQREKVLNWVNEQGVPLGDMRKATLDAILDPDDEFGIEAFTEPLPYHVHEAITLRRSLASSSVAKLQRMLDCAGVDGRVRYATQYHGARTGRDAGRLIQVQNYPRGEIGDRQGLTAEILADAILTRNVDTIRELWGPDIFSAIVSSLRSCIVPEKGKVLVAGDFASVEARNLLSMAGQHDRVEQMHAGLDVYSEMASLVFKRPINRKLPEHKKEGQIGKNCLSADTQVLTSDGWKAIVDISLGDRLWDGVEWVTHGGLLFKGFKETLNISGLRITTDHEVFDGEQWFRAGEATESMLSRAWGFAKDHGPFSGTLTQNKDTLRVQYVDAIAEQVRNSFPLTIFSPADRWDATNVQNKNRRSHHRKDIGDTQIFVRMKQPGHVCSIVFPLSNLGAALAASANLQNTMQVEVFECGRNGDLLEGAGRKDPQNPDVSSYRTFSLLMGGMIQTLKSTALTTMETMHRAICGLLPENRTTKIAGKYPPCRVDWMKLLKKSGCFEPVYDLADAGPRNRFTVMTSEGPLIVHNCVLGNGYGLGPVGFRARFCPKESIDLAMLAVNTYRTEFAPMVPKFWYGLFEASVRAVWCDHAKTYDYLGIEFRKEENDFLSMRLPSGRKLWYHRPRKGTTFTPQGDERPTWTFMSYQGKKFRRHMAWHGMITADCIQGSARDLMVGAMKRAEAAGLTTIFKVHDELVFEEVDRPDIVQVVQQIMEDVEPWALERRFRVKAEVEKMERYRK